MYSYLVNVSFYWSYVKATDCQVVGPFYCWRLI